VRIVFQLLGMVFYPLIVHLLIKLDVPWLAVAGLIVTSLVYLFLVLGLQRDTGAHRAWLALYVLFTVLGTVNLLTDTHYALFFPPLLINLTIAAVFGATLRPGGTPLVEQMMRFEYEGQPPPAALKDFARHLTWIWTLYLAGVALGSVVLALTARLEVWSLFTNILNYVFAVILLFAQYLYRFLRYRQYGVFMPWDTLRGMARLPWPGRAPSPVGNGQAPK
jgi:uncharacterized membrane protein